MALKSRSKNAEQEVVENDVVENDVVIEQEVVEEEVEQEVEKKAAPVKEKAAPVKEKEAPVKEKAVAKRETTAVTSITPGSNVIGALKDALPPVEFGTLPRIKASNGVFMDDENDELGKEIEFTLISYNDNWAITPNVKDSSANKWCRFSYDGETLNDGSEKTIAAYMDELREEGFDNPSKKRYVEVVCILDDAAESNDNIGEMVQLSLSPQSVKKFDAYKLQCLVKKAKGLMTEEQSIHITAKAKNKTFGSNTFTIFTFRTTE